MSGRIVSGPGFHMSISRTAQFRPVEHAAGRVMDGELVIINLESGLYYSSLGVGGTVWQLMEAGQSVGAIAERIARNLQAAPEMVEADVSSFLDQLLGAGVIKGSDGPASEITVQYSGAYAAPTLTAFNDLETSVALDPPLQR